MSLFLVLIAGCLQVLKCLKIIFRKIYIYININLSLSHVKQIFISSYCFNSEDANSHDLTRPLSSVFDLIEVAESKYCSFKIVLNLNLWVLNYQKHLFEFIFFLLLQIFVTEANIVVLFFLLKIFLHLQQISEHTTIFILLYSYL